MNQPFSTTNEIEDTADTPSSVAKAAKELRDAAEGKVHQAIHDAEDKVRDALQIAKDKTCEIKDRATTSANQFREAATEKATAFRDTATVQAQHLRENASEQWDETCVKAKEFQVTAEDYIRQNPTKCVIGALGIGFVIGLITRR